VTKKKQLLSQTLLLVEQKVRSLRSKNLRFSFTSCLKKNSANGQRSTLATTQQSFTPDWWLIYWETPLSLGT